MHRQKAINSGGEEKTVLMTKRWRISEFAQFCEKTLHLNNSKVYTNMLG